MQNSRTLRLFMPHGLSFGLALTGLSLAFAQPAHAEGTDAPITHQPETPQSSTIAGNEGFATQAPSALLQMGVGSSYYSPYAFVVDKKDRTLTVWTQEDAGYRRLAQFPADLGKKDGDKRDEGDHKTPEGVYFLLNRLEGPGLDFSQYGQRAFTTNYPNFFDRRDGKTGSGIWLHAVPDHVALTRGSRGCVVVRNNVILDLTRYVRLTKTPILIEKEIEYVNAQELRTQADELNAMIEGWRTAWENKDIESYIGFYADDFRSQRMDRGAWKAFKQGLNQRYETLKIKFSKPVVLRYKDRIVARFLQDYTSDQHQDFGEKTLFLRKTAAGYRIIGEEWAMDNSPLARQELEASPRSVTACAPGSLSCKTTAQASSSSTN